MTAVVAVLLIVVYSPLAVIAGLVKDKGGFGQHRRSRRRRR